MKRKILFCNIVLWILLTNIINCQPIHRYTESIFSSSKTASNQVYANAPALNSPYAGESATHNENLTLDIFEPLGDTLTLRPVLICAHGGGFISGSKEHDDMVAFCDSLAKKGYVTITINYRQGMNISSTISAERSVYRGIQDGRAVIRYLKHSASSLRIDTNSVYFLGSSAGAFIGLHNLYMNKESERPASSYQITNMPPTLDDGPDLGSLDAINNTLHYGSHPNGLISLWGAVSDTNLIELQDINIPVLLVHGTADDIVYFDVGSPFGLTSLPATYGSNPINKRLTNLGKPAETYFVSGAGHEFYGVTNGNWDPAPNAYWDTVLTLVTDFLYRQHKPTVSFSYSISGDTVQFTNLSVGCTELFWDFGDSNTSHDINPKHIYSASNMYKVTLTGLNHIHSWDTTSNIVNITGTDIENNNLKIPHNFLLEQNYPNPFNPSTKIKFTIPEAGNVKLSVYNLLGQEVGVLVNDNLNSGHYEIEFNAENLSNGMYIYRLESSGNLSVKKMILMK